MALIWPLLALLTVTTTAVTADIEPGSSEDMQDGCIHFQIIHSTNTAHFSKRAVELGLANRSDVAYYAKLNFGTPSQPQYVQLDTGSFELWVNPTCSGLSSGDAAFCNAVGHFDPSDSSSATPLGTTKSLRYGIGTANVSYVRDDIALPGTSSVLQQVQFGVATQTTDEFAGILGIGYGQGHTTRYPNFVDELALQNVTHVQAFSLALGSRDEQEGVIVFGGVDTSKYTGALARLPILPANESPDGVPRYWVTMDAVALSTQSSSYPNSSLPVFLDSGSTLTLLPAALADAIGSDFGTAANSDGYYMVDCDAATRNGTLNFAFAGTTIQVPFRELIRQSGAECMLGIQANSNFALLGDTFMRSAYVVIDQTDSVVWMAPYVNCGSTPAALASSDTLSTLTGRCSLTDNQELTGESSSASTSPTPTSPVTTSATTPPNGAASQPTSPSTTSPATSSSSPSSATSAAAPPRAVAASVAAAAAVVAAVFVLAC